MLGHTHVELHWTVLWTQHPVPSMCGVSGKKTRNLLIYNIFSSPDPTITVSIASGSLATPMVGSMYSLTCTVSGAEGLTDSMMTYQWLKDGVEVSGQTMIMDTLSFSPLASSDAGSYTCQATVTSSLLRDSITTAPSNSVDIQPMCRFSLNIKSLYLHNY